MTFSATRLIEAKRDGAALSADEIGWLISAYVDGTVPDYQMSAMSMAVYFNGLDPDELAAWTSAMLNSGEVMDFSDVAAAKVDKHSTGGVGDKISIPLAPMAAACGVAVPMMSGRGLGHTGGTLDKLESIRGFTTRLAPDEFRRILVDHGLVLAGQSETMAPADRMLYALRDATATVPSIPLICASIMSKKLAEGLDGLVLDVKTGAGAFMKTVESSRELAAALIGVGESHGVRTVAFITSMEQPLGAEVGNANEIRESIDVLRGEGPADVTELTLTLGEAMLELAGLEGGRSRLEAAIGDGSALDKLIEVAVAHGGCRSVIEDTSLLPVAPLEAVVTAPRDGFVVRCDALAIGEAAAGLGAGRERKEAAVDPGVGVTLRAKLGDRVSAGDPLAVARYSDEAKWEAQRGRLAAAWELSDAPSPVLDLVVDKVGGTP